MSRSYPIWNSITSCAYKNKNKSYGIKEHGENEVLIGYGAGNSHHFVTTKVTHKRHDDGTRTYHFYLDDILIKTAMQPPGTKEMIITSNTVNAIALNG